MTRPPNYSAAVMSPSGFAVRVEELARFIGLLTERFKARQETFAGKLEVSQRELALLQALANAGPMITKELGGRFGVPVSTMTGLVDRMERKGLIRRVPDRRDRRSIELEATPAGALALKEHDRDMEAIARGMLEALSERDQGELIDILRRVKAGIEAAATRAAG
jgi:DNA-binding MarR family transcriptional regulator